MAAHVFLAAPHYGNYVPETVVAIALPSADTDVTVTMRMLGVSLLAHNFNLLWCQFQNERQHNGYTHFGMIHSDIEAPPGWLDTLLAEMDRVGADVISAIVPMKDARGLTSTGRLTEGVAEVQRLTMAEVMALPETFDAQTAGFGDDCLAVNTGLWLARAGDWCEEFPGFAILDGVSKGKDGIYRANVLSEDWNASRWWHQRKMKVFATRKVPVVHHGKYGYRNDHVWGTETTDKGDFKPCPK